VAETWEAERHVCGMEDVFFSVMEDEGLWSRSLFGSRLRRVIYDLDVSDAVPLFKILYPNASIREASGSII